MCVTRGKRVMVLVITRLHLEAVFAWLSTLGGAHSSLGEKFVEHVSVVLFMCNACPCGGRYLSLYGVLGVFLVLPRMSGRSRAPLL